MQVSSVWATLVGQLVAFVAGAGLVGVVVRRIARRTVDTFFQKELINHKAELAGIAAAARFDYSRRLADFNRLAAKRHDVYAELYRAYQEAFDAYEEYRIRYHHRPKEYPRLSEAEVKALLGRKRVIEDRQKSILTVWDANRSEGVAKLHQALDIREKRRARSLFDRATRFWRANNVYVSADVNDAVKPGLQESFVEYIKVIEGITPDSEIPVQSREEHSTQLANNVRQALQALLGAIRTELTKGDYEPHASPGEVADNVLLPRRTD